MSSGFGYQCFGRGLSGKGMYESESESGVGAWVGRTAAETLLRFCLGWGFKADFDGVGGVTGRDPWDCGVFGVL